MLSSLALIKSLNRKGQTDLTNLAAMDATESLAQETKKACKLIKDRFGVDEASVPGPGNLGSLRALSEATSRIMLTPLSPPGGGVAEED